jgi:hypothetical protein
MRLALAIPAYGDVKYETARSLWRLTSLLTANDVIYDEIQQLRDPDLGRARNAILNGFLGCKADRLLFVDSDMSFESLQAWKLIASPLDYVGANYPRKTFAGGMTSTPKVGGARDGNCVEAEMLATGLMCLSRSAVEAMANTAPSYLSDDGHIRKAITATGPINGVWMSEDEIMCRRWQSMGRKAWIDTSIRVGHVGTHEFREAA